MRIDLPGATSEGTTCKYLCANEDCGLSFLAPKNRSTSDCPQCGLFQRLRKAFIWHEMDRKYHVSSRPLTFKGDIQQRPLLSIEGPLRYKPRRDVAKDQCEDNRFSLRPARVVVVEDSRSQWNVGSILRTAECLGWEVILCGISPTPDQVGSTINKTALGAEDWVKWYYAPRVLNVIRYFQSQNYMLVALEQTDDAKWIDHHFSRGRDILQDSADLSTVNRFIDQPVCLFIGNERDGISPETLKFVRHRVAIPMQGRKASLNVAVSFGIAAFTI